LEKQRRLKSLGTTHIVAANNHTARAMLSECMPRVEPFRNFIPPYRELGVQFEVTPTVNRDGTVTIRIAPEMSIVAPADIGNGVIANAINVQTFPAENTVKKGESLAVGFLAKNRDAKGDGGNQRKTEYLIIVTPRLLAEPKTLTQSQTDKPTQQCVYLSDV